MIETFKTCSDHGYHLPCPQCYPPKDESTRYMFIRDDDCHWYIIPIEKKKAFDNWVQSSDEYNSLRINEEYTGENFDSYMINGPERYTFIDPKESCE